MTEARTPPAGRPLPRFFVEWRNEWGEAAESWTPVDYLNQDHGVPATISAGWLFNPSTVEYRGAVFLADRFREATVDEWFTQIPDNPSRIEAVVNQVVLFDLFANCDLERYADALTSLAKDIVDCWAGILTLRYPDRLIHVSADDGTGPDSYGPAATFWTERRDHHA